MAIGGIARAITRHYDRAIALAVLLSLLGSLTYLAVRMGMIQQLADQFEDEMGRLRPKHETASPVDLAALERALGSATDVYVVVDAQWTNSAMYAPAARCICVDCRRPIPFVATNCPFCGESQPPPETETVDYDGDLDLIWDSWERDHDLNPRESSDAAEDPDDDGFSNLAEFQGEPRTDPQDASNHPPYVDYVFVKRIVPDVFQLRFESKMKTAPDSYRFGINTRSKKTHIVRIGDEVEGFRILKFEPKKERRPKEGSTMMRTVDVSILTLRRGEKVIPLVFRQSVPHVEYDVRLFFEIDNRDIDVKPGEDFLLRTERYDLIRVDRKQRRVLIRGLHTKRESWVRPLPAATATD